MTPDRLPEPSDAELIDMAKQAINWHQDEDWLVFDKTDNASPVIHIDDVVKIMRRALGARSTAAQPVEPIMPDAFTYAALNELAVTTEWGRGWDACREQFLQAAVSGDSTPPSEPVQGDSIGAPRPEPEAAGQDCHGLDTPERVRFYEHDFYVLSNFSAFTLQWKGHRFDTSEAAYHWEKFSGDSGAAQLTRHFILTAPSAHEAFKLAEHNKPHRRADWDDVKVGIMRNILRAKAKQHEYVRRKLLATGDRELVEDSWRDDFWGWGPNRDGKNMLGKLWMEVRAELRSPPAASQQADREAE